MKMKVIVLLSLAIAAPLFCGHRTKKKDPYWDIKELATKRANRGKNPRRRSVKPLRTQCNFVRGFSVQKALEFLEPKDDVSTN